MKPRINFLQVNPEAVQPMMAMQSYVDQSGLDHDLLNLVKLRASLINGCAFCIDMHTKEACAHGETEQRLFGLTAWEETPYFNERERAALAWTDAVTSLTDGHVPDAAFAQASEHFSEGELVDLTVAITTINAWNRISIAFRAVPGSHPLRAR